MSKTQDKQIEIFNNVNLAGLALNKYQGGTGSVAELVNLDIHSEGGVLKNSQELKNIDTSNIVDDDILAPVACSDGNSYLFARNNGKVWKVAPDGVLSLETTLSSGVSGASEYDGYIYFAKFDKLGRVAVPAATSVDWSAKDENWKTFTNKDIDFHPMLKLNLILYIGDGNLVAQVREGVFAADALDIKKPWRIRALGAGQRTTELLIGTHIKENVGEASVIRWNTWSPSYTVEDFVPETSINSFLKVDNEILVSAGDRGNLYTYNGADLIFKKKLSGDFSETKITVNNNASANFRGLPLFAVSQVEGNGIKYGIYSWGRLSPEVPMVTALEFIGSHGSEIDVQYGSIVRVEDGFLITWKRGTEYGVDKLDITKKATGYITSRIINYDRTNKSEFGKVYIPIENSRDNGEIKLFHKKQNEDWKELTVEWEATRNQFATKSAISENSFSQFKLVMIPNENKTLKVQGVFLHIKN